MNPKSELLLRKVYVKDVCLGDTTSVANHVLSINRSEFINYLLQDHNLKSVDVRLARPGESKRIIPVKDVLEPRAKLDSKVRTSPGFMGSAESAGTGITCCLDGVAVVTCGKLVNFQEGLIDMVGPGAEFSQFSRTLNIVLLFEPVEGLSKHEHEKSVREAGVKAAHYLGMSATNAEFDSEIRYPMLFPLSNNSYSHLPGVVYVDFVIAQGLLHDNYIYGKNAQEMSPVLLSPTELMDGAIVSGNCAAPCHKNTTYHQQNNPVVEDLFAEHGKTLGFLGCIAMPVKTALREKELNCAQVLKMTKDLWAKGVIISEDGGGNPDTDLMILARLFKKEGIHTVILTDEYAGRDGASPGMADVTPEADAMVTNGNGNQYVNLPPMEEVIGYPEAVDVITGGHSGSLHRDGHIEVEIAAIMGSTVEVGSGNLTTIAI